ncbi:MAG TPA: hypothetical protein HPQ03_08580 [Deltaproteobacteria bacterium]|nr:hypothetical protein [Deltaproteobacteria bacterium]
MISSINSSISALKAFEKKMGVTANNVANVESEEFKKSRAVMTEGARKEVRVEIEKIETSGPIVSEIEDGKVVEKELSNVDLVEEIPQTIIAQRNFEANLKSIQAQEETLNSFLDIIG